MCVRTGCLIGEDDANQALQADINADPTTHLTAAALYQDTSAWLSKALAARSPHPAEPDPREAESAHDQLIEVEDGGLEGGQVPGEQVSATPVSASVSVWMPASCVFLVGLKRMKGALTSQTQTAALWWIPKCHHLAVLLIPPGG